MVLMTATIRRRSEAVGLRVARMRLQSSSIATSMALTLWSSRTTSSPSAPVARVERLDAVQQLLLDEAAHLQHRGAHALEVRVEAAQDVMRQVGLFHAGLRRVRPYTGARFRGQASRPPARRGLAEATPARTRAGRSSRAPEAARTCSSRRAGSRCSSCPCRPRTVPASGCRQARSRSRHRRPCWSCSGSRLTFTTTFLTGA